MHNDLPELLTGAETRKFLGLSSAVWMELTETGQLPDPVLVGNRRKWRKADIVHWLSATRSIDLFAKEASSNG